MDKLSGRTIAFQPNERNLFFHILTACNLSCRHCYINPDQHGVQTLPKEVLADWLGLFYSPDKETNVVFLGGEPTLHPDLPFAVEAAKKLGYRSITIDTNGYLHHDLLEKISPNDAVLSFSLDGPCPEINDSIRGKGVFDTCTRALRKAVNAGFEVGLIYTVSSMNIDSLHLMPAIAADMGVAHFFIQVIGLRGRWVDACGNDDASRLQVPSERWLATVPGVAEKAARLGLHVIYPKLFLGPEETFECAGNVAENYFIFPNSRVYRCPLCEDHPIHFARIEEGRLIKNTGLTEDRFFSLTIPEGCVMNKLLQPGTLQYDRQGRPRYRISCCLLKQEVR